MKALSECAAAAEHYALMVFHYVGYDTLTHTRVGRSAADAGRTETENHSEFAFERKTTTLFVNQSAFEKITTKQTSDEKVESPRAVQPREGKLNSLESISR